MADPNVNPNDVVEGTPVKAVPSLQQLNKIGGNGLLGRKKSVKALIDLNVYKTSAQRDLVDKTPKYNHAGRNNR